MRRPYISAELRDACRTHVRLLDKLIELTASELEASSSDFTTESLQELLESMREERRTYGAFASPVTVYTAQIDNAA